MNQKINYGVTKRPYQRSLFAPFFSNIPSIFDEGFDDDLETVSSSNISLSEDDNNVYVEANLPGLKEEDIELVLDKGVLWIKGSHQEKQEDKERQYYYKASRSFSYRVSLPGDVSENVQPQAELKNGVIHVVFQKATKEQPKKIQIKKS